MGSLIENVVVHDAGNHAFVPHLSDGVTMRGTISHNTYEAAYWWDGGETNATNDITWDHAVASQVIPVSAQQGYRMTAFVLGAGENDTVTNSVAVGVQGSVNASGFLWPEGTNQVPHNVWNYNNNTSHNNEVDGIFVWQNDFHEHLIEDYVGYYNGETGIDHGAYTNEYLYRNLTLYGNGDAGFRIHATSNGGAQSLELDNLTIDGAGISTYGIEIVKHTLPGGQRTVIRNSNLSGYTDTGIAWTFIGDPVDTETERFMLDNNTFEAGTNEYYLSNDITADSLITVQEADGSIYQLRRYDQSGTLVSAWNARKTDLSAWSDPTYSGYTTTEDFTGTDFDPWPSQWDVTENDSAVASIYGNEGRVIGAGLVTAMLNDSTAVNVDSHQEVTLRGTSGTTGMQGGLIARRSDSDSDSYYMVTLHSHYNTGQELRLIRVVDGAEAIMTSVSSAWSVNTDYHLTFEVEQRNYYTTDLRVKLWADGATEPSEWTLNVDDTAAALQNVAGRVGIYANAPASTSRQWYFDDYATDEIPTLTVTEDWTGTNGSSWDSQWTGQAIGGTQFSLDIQGNEGRLTKGYFQTDGKALAYINDQTATDVDIVSDFRINQGGIDFGLFARGYDDSGDGNIDTFFYAEVDYTQDRLYLRKYTSSGITSYGSAYYSAGIIPNTDYRIRFHVENGSGQRRSI